MDESSDGGSVEAGLGERGGFCMLGGGRGDGVLGPFGILVGVDTAEGLPTSVDVVPLRDPAESNSSAVLRGQGNLICL